MVIGNFSFIGNFSTVLVGGIFNFEQDYWQKEIWIKVIGSMWKVLLGPKHTLLYLFTRLARGQIVNKVKFALGGFFMI